MLTGIHTAVYVLRASTLKFQWTKLRKISSNMASKSSELNVKIEKITESVDTEQKENVLNTSHSLDLTKKEIQSIEESEDLPPSPTISDQSADPELKESASDAADNTPRISILCVGDSLTWEYNNGGRRQYPYADTLSDKLRDHYEESAIFEVMECGVSGELVTGGMVDRIATVLSHRTFDIVIHLGGMCFACILTVHSIVNISFTGVSQKVPMISHAVELQNQSAHPSITSIS